VSKPPFNGSAYSGPDLEDCIRLWTTIVKELVTDAEVQLQLPLFQDRAFRPRLVLLSPGFDPETGGKRWHIWATKDLQAGYEAITYRQLYDLLIIAYREMESHLGGQSRLPLP
jgi:hypothetical protein